MSSLKEHFFTLMKVPESIQFHLTRSRTHIFTALLLSFSLFFFLSSSSSLANHSVVITTAVSLASRVVLSASTYIPPFSPITSSGTHFVSDDPKGNCTLTSVTTVERTHHGTSRKTRADLIRELTSCDIFDGKWIPDRSAGPLYNPGSCPFVDDSFDCFKNGRPDSEFLRYRWKPHGCKIPRFNGRKMLGMLRGKRLVFVGDSLNRNMWESLVCALRESLKDKSRVFEVSGRHEFRTRGHYSFRFKDFKCSIDFIKSPFLVQEWKISDEIGGNRETLRLDMIQNSSSNYYDADIIIFNTGHWWTHPKTYKGKGFFQEGGHVYSKLEVSEAYTKALLTWAQWVDTNINSTRTRVFFRGYSASHFKGGQWNSGGSCDGETQPIMNDAYLAPYPWMMSILESVIAEMKTPVFYLNITKMTGYRKDGHPSTYRLQELQRNPRIVQDCSHWCLPGIPDSWNELLYVTLLISHHDLQSNS